MSAVASIPGIEELWSRTTGDPRIRVAVLDGPVDRGHTCFGKIQLQQFPSCASPLDGQQPGPMTAHGTHVASVIFGGHESPVKGIAPGCTGLIIPVFSESRRKLSQLDLSRAIETAVAQGAQIINVSGGQLTDHGEADGWLEHALEFCEDNNVLVIAAAGNDGCECLHVPAALPTVLAVGAMDEQGHPLDFSNWGATYRTQGVLAPGKDILGARPGGGTIRKSGTSLACPIVSGIAALMLSDQLNRGRTADPAAVRTAILQGAQPCDATEMSDCSRFLVGTLNVAESLLALSAIESKGLTMSERAESLAASSEPVQVGITTSCACESQAETGDANSEVFAGEMEASSHGLESPGQGVATAAHPQRPRLHTSRGTGNTSSSRVSARPSAVAPSQLSSDLTYAFEPGAGLLYALGTIGYDFGTEARRDSFKQLMVSVFPIPEPPAGVQERYEAPLVPNPYDARALVAYLKYLQFKGGKYQFDFDDPTYEFLDEAKSLIWTLNLELTPIYGIEPLGPFSRDVYKELVDLLDGQVRDPQTDKDYVERVSLPGLLANRTVRLFSGQALPIVEVENKRGLYGWQVEDLVEAALQQIKEQPPLVDLYGQLPSDAIIRDTIKNFLNRIYYDFRNLGTTAPDRALNFSVTNMVQNSAAFAQALAQKRELDTIEVVKSPTCRLDSDCWDVKLKFFFPGDLTKAVTVVRLTVDVSDKMPVTLGTLRTWAQRY